MMFVGIDMTILNMSKKGKTPANTIRERLESATNWREKLLKLDVNGASKFRTCQTFFLVERNESSSVVINKFHNAAKIDKLHQVKCFSYEDLLKKIRQLADPTKICTKSCDIFYKAACEEASVYLNANQCIPSDLLANLIKLHIIYMINYDVGIAQSEVLFEEEHQNEYKALGTFGNEDETDKKGKKGGKEKKGGADKKDKKGKGKKGTEKTTEKAYDVCDPDNEPIRSIESKRQLLISQDEVPLYDTVEVESRHLFFVVVGIFDFDVIEDLFKIGVPLVGILELRKQIEKNSISPSISIEIERLSELGEAEEDWTTESEITIQSEESAEVDQVAKCPTDKSESLHNFWNVVNKNMEEETCPGYLDNSYYMTLVPPEEFFVETSLNDQTHCSDVFTSIGREIAKIIDVQRQYATYLRNLKIYPVDSNPTLEINCKSFDSISSAIPPDCFNVCTFTHALIEETAANVSDPYEALTAKSGTSTSTSSNSGTNQSPSDIVLGQKHRGIKIQIADIIQRYAVQDGSCLKTEFLTKLGVKENGSKLNMALSNKQFMIEEGNDIGLMSSPYERVSSKLFQVNFNKLTQTLPVLLWKRFSGIPDQKLSVNKYQLVKLGKELGLEVSDLQCVIHTLLFSSLCCSQSENNTDSSAGLKALFPQRNVNHFEVEKQNISYRVSSGFVNTIDDAGKEEESGTKFPYVQYRNTPNIYEAKNITAYKWYETLSTAVMLQELYKAQQEYTCLDYRYCLFDDTILLRYHKNLNHFGINVTTWNQNLRTPILIREFCKYILHEDGKWLQERDDEYFRNYDEAYKKAVVKNEAEKKSMYPEVVLTPLDFIIMDSIKGRALLEQRKAEEAKKNVAVDKKGKKGADKKGKEKKGKPDKGGKKGKDDKGKAKQPSRTDHLDKLFEFIPPPPYPKISPRLALPEEPFTFNAYDISENRLQLVGSSTTYQSLDGVKVSVDQTRLIGNPHTLSLDVNIAGHSLILHHNQVSIREPFTFHFTLSDQTVIAFAKPLPTDTPESIIGEKICRQLKQQRSSSERQTLYFVTEKQNCVSRCFDVPFITKRNLVLSEELVEPFLTQLKLRGIKAKLTASTVTLTSDEVRSFSAALSSSKSNLKIRKSSSALSKEVLPLRCSYDVLSQTNSNNSKEESKLQMETSFDQLYSYLLPPGVRTKSVSEDVSNIEEFKVTLRQIKKKIKEAISSSLPIFKICSSPYHKYQYVRRIKSHVNVQIGTVLKRIACKPFSYKSKTNIKITKLIPIIQKSSPGKKYNYDIETSLPSGLNVKTVPGTKGELFQIRQRYVDKGPQCKSIENEVSRTFTRCGLVLIKLSNGDVHVLSNNGEIVKCEMPHLKVKSSVVEKRAKRCPGRQISDLAAMHVNTGSLTKFQQHLQQTLRRLRKHVIKGPESLNRISRKSCKRWKRTHVRDPDQIYFLQTSVAPMRKFCLITIDGKKLKITRTYVSEEKKYFTSTVMDYRYQEVYCGREDGTHSIFDHDSFLTTQFPDGTRISTWMDVEPELFYTEKIVRSPWDERCKEQQVSSEDFSATESTVECTEFSENVSEACAENLSENCQENCSEFKGAEEETVSSKISPSKPKKPEEAGWTIVNINFKYEHPNYATVAYCSVGDKCMVTLPNQVILSASNAGDYVLNVNESISASIDTRNLTCESRLCSKCSQKCVSSLNIEPLYNKKIKITDTTELLRVTDSFKKIFKVNYDGKCLRNAKYILGRQNLVRCGNHNLVEHQKLFVLNRNLKGCKLWDLNSLRNRIDQAKCDKNVTVEFQEHLSLIEILTLSRRPYSERFLIPYDEPKLLLSKNKTENPPPRDAVYKKRQVIHELPNISKLQPIYSTLGNIFCEKQLKVGETILFLNQVAEDRQREIMMKEEEEREKLKIVVPEPKTPPIPLEEKQRTWRLECQTYLKKIRNGDVPTYFGSQYDKTHENDAEEMSKNVNSLPPTENLNERSPAKEATFNLMETNSVKINSLNVIEGQKTDETAKSETAEIIPAAVEATDVPTGTDRKEEIDSIPAIPKTEENNNYSTHATIADPPFSDQFICPSPEKPWYDTDIGKLLLLKTATRIENYLRQFKIEEKGKNVADIKVQFVTRRVFHNLAKAVPGHNWRISANDYGDAVALTVFKELLKQNLNPSETNSLLENIKRGPGQGSKTGSALCSDLNDLARDDRCKAHFKKYDATKECKETKLSKFMERSTNAQKDSAFDVYKQYAGEGGHLKFSVDIDTSELYAATENVSVCNVHKDQKEVSFSAFETHEKNAIDDEDELDNEYLFDEISQCHWEGPESLEKIYFLPSFSSCNEIAEKKNEKEKSTETLPKELLETMMENEVISKYASEWPITELLETKNRTLFHVEEVTPVTDDVVLLEKKDVGASPSLMVSISMRSLFDDDSPHTTLEKPFDSEEEFKDIAEKSQKFNREEARKLLSAVKKDSTFSLSRSASSESENTLDYEETESEEQSVDNFEEIEKSGFERMLDKMQPLLDLIPHIPEVKYKNAPSITDLDAQIAKGINKDVNVLTMTATPAPKQRPVKKSVGSQANAGTDDQGEQTLL